MKLFIAHLLLNILFIIASILLYHLFWIRKGKTSPRLNTIMFLSICILATIACLTFAAEPYTGYLFDFRHLILIITTLMGGPAAGGIILGVMSVYRLFLGGDGAVIGIVCSAAAYIFLLCTYSKFRAASFRKKTALSILVDFIFVLWTPVFLRNVLNPYEYTLYVVVYLICSVAGTYIILYLVEVLTEQLKLQKELVNIEKFQLIGEMAASISHEIRNPLTSTRGFLQLLQSDAYSPEERRLYLHTAIRGIDEANRVITDYLTFAKPSVETTQVLHVETELNHVMNLVTPLANFGNVVMRYHKPVRPLYIKGERQKLQQCLLNIVKNCIEAMPGGGFLDISVKEMDGFIYIAIQDTGIGMNKEQLARLGSPFYSTKEKGTGLGMMVVFSVVKAMSGTIEVSSQVNEGATFHLSFPSAHIEKT